jgi:hypothetical protein
VIEFGPATQARSSSAPAKRGRGAARRAVEGAQDSTRRKSLRDIQTFSLARSFLRRESSATITKLKARRPLHYGSLAARAPVVPLPRYRGGGRKSALVLAMHPHPSFADQSHEAFASRKIRGGRAPKGANPGPHHRMRRALNAARSPFGALPRLLLRPCAGARSRPRFTRCRAQALPASWRRA